MKDRFLDILSAIGVTVVFIAIIVLLILRTIQIDVNRDKDKWNNGYHSCGGKWVYEQAIGHRYSTNYIYKCDKCNVREEFIEYRNN